MGIEAGFADVLVVMILAGWLTMRHQRKQRGERAEPMQPAHA